MLDLDPQLETRIRDIVPRLDGWCPVEKGLAMARSLCELRPRVCVEIGVFGGRSLLPQALACQSLQHGHVFGIDPWSATDSLEAMSQPDDIAYWSQVDHEAIFRLCRQAVLDEDLTPYCSLIRAQAQHCGDLFCNIDFLHIDGNHSRDIAVRDVRMFLPKVRDAGHIWFDDADWPSTQDAVQLLRESCDVVRDYGSYLHFRKRSRESVALPPMVEPFAEPPSLLPPRRVLTLPHGALGSFGGGLYNPGAALHGEHFVLLARNERFSESERKANPARQWGSCRPFAVSLTRSGDFSSSSPLSVPTDVQADRAEDFRLFRWRSELFASFSRVRTTGQIEIQVAAVDLEKLELGTPLTPRLDTPIAVVEKNWCFFEHLEELYCVYSFQPFHLLRLVDRDTFQFQTVTAAPVSLLGQSHSLHLSRQVSLSTSPVEFRGDLILFIHQRDNAMNYQHYAVWLDAATLQPRRTSRTPIFSGGNACGLRPNVLYLMSVLCSEEDYWFFFGEGDEHVSFLTLTESQLSDLLADSIEIRLENRSGLAPDDLRDKHGPALREIGPRFT